MLVATYTGDRSHEIVAYFLSLGVSPNTHPSHEETPLYSAIQKRQYETARLLFEAGADESSLNWTPLIRAVAFGELDRARHEIAVGANIDATDSLGFSALHHAVRREDEEMVDVLLKSGATRKSNTEANFTCLSLAAESGNLRLVQRLIDAENSFDETMGGQRALYEAIAGGYHEIIRLLLSKGVRPDCNNKCGCDINDAPDRETVEILLETGVDPALLDLDTLRKLLNLEESDPPRLLGLTRDQYMAARYERAGDANPEDLTEPFKLAMIRDGGSAYCARTHFNDRATIACRISWDSRPPQVWCFDRFGMSFTRMPDGRAILIAGEHEDSYDPDFCIYNDVMVFFPSGDIKIFGYPREVFEPTDFHTATLVGDHVWIIGGLGYVNQRQGPIPVYRLDTRDYSIERIQTGGSVPGRIFKHKARLDGREIVVSGGRAIRFKRKKEDHLENSVTYRLDLDTRAWR